MGNGNRAQQRRDRQAKSAPGVAKSQLKVNEAAREYQCAICKSTFLKTANLTLLTEHALNKHKSGADKCFDRLPEETAKEKTKRLVKEAEDKKKAELEEAKRLAKEEAAAAAAAKKRAEEEKKKDGEVIDGEVAGGVDGEGEGVKKDGEVVGGEEKE